MKRLNLMVPDSQYDWLYEQSEELDISVAEIVRRALDAWIKSRSESPPLFEFKPRSNFFGWPRGDNSSLANSIREVQEVVGYIEQALRRTASPETMAAFDAAIAGLRERHRLLSPLGENPESRSDEAESG